MELQVVSVLTEVKERLKSPFLPRIDRPLVQYKLLQFGVNLVPAKTSTANKVWPSPLWGKKV